MHALCMMHSDHTGRKIWADLTKSSKTMYSSILRWSLTPNS